VKRPDLNQAVVRAPVAGRAGAGPVAAVLVAAAPVGAELDAAELGGAVPVAAGPSPGEAIQPPLVRTAPRC
jgi:hypothetical protein